MSAGGGSTLGVTFGYDDTDVAAEAIAIAIRRDLMGLVLDRSSVGTCFTVEVDPSCPALVVELLDAPAMPVRLNDALHISLMAARGGSGPDDLGRPQQPMKQPLPGELLAQIEAYVAAGWRESGSEQAVRRSTLAIDELVDIPKADVLHDIVLRLRGDDWSSAWSDRHYRQRVPALDLMRRSVPLILLSGDPGTGKSALMHLAPPLVARALGEQLVFVQLNERLRGLGIQGRAGAELVAAMTAIADHSERFNTPTLVFIDEAEAVVTTRGSADVGSGSQENVAVVDALIVALDRVFSRPGARVAVALATNVLDRIDPAVARRATTYEFPRPTSEGRKALLASWLHGVMSDRDRLRLHQLLDRPGLQLTAADIMNQVVGRALREAIALDTPVSSDTLFSLARDAMATQPVRSENG